MAPILRSLSVSGFGANKRSGPSFAEHGPYGQLFNHDPETFRSQSHSIQTSSTLRPWFGDIVYLLNSAPLDPGATCLYEFSSVLSLPHSLPIPLVTTRTTGTTI